jgi:tetratricopeptide (TPR) repeat protein
MKPLTSSIVTPKPGAIALAVFSPRAFAFTGATLAVMTLAGCGNVPFMSHSDVTARPAHSDAAPAPHASNVSKATKPELHSLSPIDEMREHAALEPAEPYWPYHLAELYVAADSIGLAEAALRQAIARDASYAPAYSLLSSLEYKSGRHREAIEQLEAARANTQAFPNGLPPELLAGLALHYDALDNAELAHSVMASMPPHASDDVEAARVYVTLRGDHPDSATSAAEHVLRSDSKSAANQNNYGITRLRAGDPKAAGEAFMKAIKLDATLPGPYYNLALLEKYYNLNDDEATRWFGLYWERSHDDPDGVARVFGKTDAKQLAGKGTDE